MPRQNDAWLTSLHQDGAVGSSEMAEEPPHVVLEYLRRIDRKVDGLVEDFRLFNVRVVATESQGAGLHISDVQQNSVDRSYQGTAA
jgi:hypothetical protein